MTATATWVSGNDDDDDDDEAVDYRVAIVQSCHKLQRNADVRIER